MGILAEGGPFFGIKTPCLLELSTPNWLKNVPRSGQRSIPTLHFITPLAYLGQFSNADAGAYNSFLMLGIMFMANFT